MNAVIKCFLCKETTILFMSLFGSTGNATILFPGAEERTSVLLCEACLKTTARLCAPGAPRTGFLWTARLARAAGPGQFNLRASRSEAPVTVHDGVAEWIGPDGAAPHTKPRLTIYGFSAFHPPSDTSELVVCDLARLARAESPDATVACAKNYDEALKAYVKLNHDFAATDAFMTHLAERWGRHLAALRRETAELTADVARADARGLAEFAAKVERVAAERAPHASN